MQLQHNIVPGFSKDLRLQSGTVHDEHSICTATAVWILAGTSHHPGRKYEVSDS